MATPQIGKYNKHVNESYGADHNIMKFYITEYSSQLGKETFSPKSGYCTGTGYKSNIRPGVYYSRKLDELDNPSVGKLLTSNYKSVTRKDYVAYKGDDGNAPLPNDTKLRGNSSFVKSTKPTNFMNHLQIVPPPSTEYRNKFDKKSPHIDTNEKTIGPQQETGFTRSKNLEPVTFRPHNNFKDPYPEYYTFRPTGESVTKNSFRPFSFPAEKAPLPNIDSCAVTDTGFTRYILPTTAHTADRENSKTHPYESVHQSQYKGQQLPSTFPRVNNTMKKEQSGFALNNKPFNPMDTEYHGKESTIYGMQFFDKNKRFPNEASSYQENIIDDILPDGYTKSEKLHKPFENYDVTSQLMTLHPYVNRSLKARDPFYCDTTHQHKRR